MTYPFNNPALSLKERVKDLISRLTIEEKAGFFPTRNFAVERLGVPEFRIGAEGAHGFVNRDGNNTTFVQTIGLAATWDRALLGRVGKIAATEARCFFKANDCKGGLAIWSPTIDLERDPRWGRTEEGYGEDPFLVSELSCEYIRGAQGDDPFYLRVSCGPKHFLANNNEKDRGSCSCSIPPRLLHEYYLVPFKNAIQKAKAVSLMTAYNEVNGIPMMLHPILQSIVKDEWGLEGHIVTDGGDFLHTVKLHNYFETHGETFAAAIINGADSMTDMPDEILNAIKEALERKLISEAELDKSLERILAIRIRLGLLDNPASCPYDSIDEKDYMKDEYIETARDAVKKSAVLLKNDNGILPLRPNEIKGSIAVIGPLAEELHLDWYAGRPSYFSTPLDGLKKVYGDKINYTDCRDIVSFTTEEGYPLTLIDVKDAEGGIKKTLAAGDKNKKPAQFYLEDWGWGANTLTDVESGMMLEGCYARREAVIPGAGGLQPPPIPNPPVQPDKYDDSAVSITATARNNLSWFGYTLFNIIRQDAETVIIKTHDNRRIKCQDAGLPVRQHDSPYCEHGSSGTRFKMKIERDGLAAAADAAGKAEQVVFFAGNDPMINGREEVDRPGLSLPLRQVNLLNAITSKNPRTILYILSGYPFTLGELESKIPAIVWMAHGIQETGNGIADIISGAYSPAGRLPLTWYEDESQLPSIMEYDIMQAGATYQYFTGSVLYPFGHGLSYSAFSYFDLAINKSEAGKGDNVIITFKIKNTGSVTADEVPQMYVTFSGSALARPVKTLKGFTRIELSPGEEKAITFELPAEELSVWDNYNARFSLENGYCTVTIGASSEDIRLAGGFKVKGETLLPRSLPCFAAAAPGLVKVIHAERFDNYADCYLHERRGFSVPAVFNSQDGAWIHFASLDFTTGVSRIDAIVQGVKTHNAGAGYIEVRLDSPDGHLAGTLDIPNTGDISFYPLPKTSYRRLPSWGYTETCLDRITGVHDVFFVFYGKVGLWQFNFSA